MQGRKEIQPKMMYQVSLDSLVSEDNFYRLLDKGLDLTFLYRETASYYGKEGQESIDPVVFFKICIVGYMNNIISDRKLMEFCANRLDVRLYLKYDIDESLPWHSTISRTRQLYGEAVFLALFQKVLSLCIEKGMVRARRQVVDSVFVKANASLDSLVAKDIMEDVSVYVGELNENEEAKTSVLKTEPVSNETTGENKKRPTSNKTHYSPTDPDARISVKPGKATNLNYYGQIAVDDAHHVITGANADFADKRDSQCLEKIVSQTAENLGQNNLSIDQLLADAGYSSGESLHFIEENKFDAYIPVHGSYKHTRDGFIYNKEKDQYECTQGAKAILSFTKIVKEEDHQPKRVYISKFKNCKDCALRTACIGSGKFKKITDSIDRELYEKMYVKTHTRYAARMAKIRSKTVEPVIGTLINFMAMKKINAKGIEQAEKHVMMAAVCYNLKKYFRFMKNTKGLAVVMGLPKAINKHNLGSIGRDLSLLITNIYPNLS